MKLFSNRFLRGCCCLLMAAAAGCEYDDTELRNDLNDLKNRVTQIESQIKGLNTDISSLQDIVKKLQENVYVAKVENTADGCRLTFTDGTSVEIKNGKNGIDGNDGKDGQDGKDAPVIGVGQDTDGVYYWTLTAGGTTDWLLGPDGKKIPAVGVTPQLGIDKQGYWTVSYDGGKTFVQIPGPDGEPVPALQDSKIFKEVTYDDDFVYVTLADGTTIEIPRRSHFYLLIREAAEPVEFSYGETRTFALESVGVERIVVTKPDEWKVNVEGETLTVTAPSAEHVDCADKEGEVTLIYFSAGKLSSAVSMKVMLAAPKTIGIEVVSSGLREGNLYPGEMAVVSVDITPSADDFLYNIVAYNVTRYEDSPEAVLDVMLGTLNNTMWGDGWEMALGAGYITKGAKTNYEIPYLHEDEDYRIAVCAVERVERDGRKVAVAISDVFLTDIIHTEAYSTSVDLGAAGTSNCYIVGKPDTQYRFDAKVMGNGAATPGITPRKIEPKDVFIVWETGSVKNAVIKEVSLDEDGYVTFTTGDVVNGNALIAVTDGEPTEDYSRGTILWSWHIWAIDYTQDKDKKVTNHDGKEFMMMDCNLGDWSTGTTITATSSFWGMKYQWGRKDPFIYFPYGTNAATVTHEPDYVWQRTYGYPATAEESLQLAVSNPTVYFQGSYSTNNDWYGVGTGAGNRNNNLWGNAEGDPDTAVKTIYDPCPAGYKVAPVEAFSGFFADGLETTSLTGSRQNMNVQGDCNIGWNFITTGSEYSYFPLAGYMSNGSIYSITRTGCYFTSTPGHTTTSNTQVRMMRLETTSGYFNTGNRADGSAVRCVRE